MMILLSTTTDWGRADNEEADTAATFKYFLHY